MYKIKKKKHDNLKKKPLNVYNWILKMKKKINVCVAQFN